MKGRGGARRIEKVREDAVTWRVCVGKMIADDDDVV